MLVAEVSIVSSRGSRLPPAQGCDSLMFYIQEFNDETSDMAARLSCITFLLELASLQDKLEQRRQAQILRSLNPINTNRNYIRIFRLTEELIVQLEADIIPIIPKEKRKGGISNHTKVLCALAFLASGSYQKILGQNLNTYMSQSSVSRAIVIVINAISNPKVLKKYIKFPQNISERQLLKEKFYDRFRLPGVIGCIDGTLVSMIRPKHNEERYYCRKGYHARNAIIINDPDLNILHVDVTFGGATHDSFIFNNSVIKLHLEQLSNTGETAFLLGDSGFAQRSYMIAPCSNPIAGSQEAHYNQLHATARNTAERTIGILKGRFRCLLVHRVLHYDPDMVAKIILACCVLHNICNRAGLPAPELPAYLQRREQRVLRLLHTTREGRPIDDLENGRLARDRLINRLWRARSEFHL